MLQDADWVERISQGGRVVIGVWKEQSPSMQIALTQDEETVSFSMFQRVYCIPTSVLHSITLWSFAIVLSAVLQADQA